MPMLPTAPTSLDEYSPGPVRRHTGQPLGSGEKRGSDYEVTMAAILDNEQRATKPQRSGHEQLAVCPTI